MDTVRMRLFADNVREIAKETGFSLRNLSIELNRECRYHSIDTLKSFTASLREKGVRVGIDDFSRGNAWLKTFDEIEPDFVKFGNGLVLRRGCGTGIPQGNAL